MTEIITYVLGSSFISGIVTFFLTKRKYNGEVKEQDIKNMDSKLKFYEALCDDMNNRLNIIINQNKELSEKVTVLQNEVIMLQSKLKESSAKKTKKKS